jgi:hypothetical protein
MFRRGTKLISEGREEDKEFKKLRLALHRRLGLRPWHPNIFDVDLYVPDEPHQFLDWKWIASLRDQLAELARPRLVREDREEGDEAGDTGHAEPLR